MASTEKEFVMPYGTWGARSSNNFFPRILRRVDRILLHTRRDFVKSVTALGVLEDGSRFFVPDDSSTHGEPVEIILENKEILIGIRGSYGGSVNGSSVITSLSFDTNLRSYGPYGTVNGTRFHCNPGLGIEIVSFVGYTDHPIHGNIMYGIGVYCRLPRKIFDPQSDRVFVSSPAAFYSDVVNIMKTAEWKPWPSLKPEGQVGEGTARDDGIYRGIRQIIVRHDDSILCAMRVEYEISPENFVWGTSYGRGTDGRRQEEIKFDYPDEYLMSIEFTSGPATTVGLTDFTGPEFTGPATTVGFTDFTVILSIIFKTNMRSYGPFGTPASSGGKTFTTPPSGVRILGFFGNSGRLIDSIGVHLAVQYETVSGDDKKAQLQRGWREFVPRLLLQKALAAGSSRPNA